MIETKDYQLGDMKLKKFFKTVQSILHRELKENPNYRIKATIVLDFSGKTTADVNIVTYENQLILDEVENEKI